ncbi:hypothetical protein EGR_00076 [Echinococcus granulosus]|uniref:Protein memo1 n=1 Tax=Echinococcus granulosus TaxID=6210 RepID=W6V1J0_ECHGR|nr:hypothetical protein EGR_00076 [Echinococcus granulosus]EUB64807.1 hypothetical protein EGR_00076 [Echinococcus granulosus]
MRSGVLFLRLEPDWVDGPTQYHRKRIFVITPHERLVENRFLLSSCDCLMTSNYSIPVDKDISHEIWKTGSCEYISRLEDERNLGVEIQLPFITKIMEDHKENFTIIPIYVGLIEFKNISWFAMKLMPYFKDKTNLFIFSLSLTHWGSIYGFDKLNESKPTVLDTIKEHDICAIEALKTLNFKAFDLQISLAKTPLPDFPVWGIFLKLAQTLLNEEEYRCRKLPDAEFFKAYQEVGELKVHGLAWSLPDLTKDRSSISFVSASFRRELLEEQMNWPSMHLQRISNCVVKSYDTNNALILLNYRRRRVRIHTDSAQEHDPPSDPIASQSYFALTINLYPTMKKPRRVTCALISNTLKILSSK